MGVDLCVFVGKRGLGVTPTLNPNPSHVGYVATHAGIGLAVCVLGP